MSEPAMPQSAPYPVEVEKGKTYYWCACGLSSRQPFCSGAHKTTTFTPVEFTAEETKRIFFCGCKRSENQPFCDGTHKKFRQSA